MTAARYLLDANTCIYIINRRSAKVFEHFAGLKAGDVAISSITGAELAYGVAKSGSQRTTPADWLPAFPPLRPVNRHR